jgi:hypothetical protein
MKVVHNLMTKGEGSLKNVIFLFLLMSISTLLAANDAAAIFTMVNPSSSSRAMGDITGVADPWRNDAFASWSNPAFASLHEGIQFGYVSEPWFKEIVDYIKFKSSYVAIGYHGLGIMVPSVIGKNQFGTAFRYDYRPTPTSTMRHEFENAREYAISYNILHHTNAVLAEQNPNKSFDLSIGLSNTQIETAYYDAISNGNIHNKADMTDFGVLFLYKQKKVLQLANGNVQFSFGFKQMNLGSNRIQQDGNKYPLPTESYVGVGAYYELPYLSLTSYNPFDAKNLLTAKVLIARTAFGTIPNMSSYGAEMGFYDLLYGRAGYYYDWQGDIIGFAGGAGLHLHYLKKLEANFNYSWYLQYSFIEHENSYDLTLSWKF